MRIVPARAQAHGLGLLFQVRVLAAGHFVLVHLRRAPGRHAALWNCSRSGQGDFGSGYSSLSYSCWLPANSLKIDRPFLHDIGGSGSLLPVLQGIVLLAHSMGLIVVAEGVETVQEFELLVEAGCDKMQGRLYREPLREAEARALLSRPEPLRSVVLR